MNCLAKTKSVSLDSIDIFSRFAKHPGALATLVAIIRTSGDLPSPPPGTMDGWSHRTDLLQRRQRNVGIGTTSPLEAGS
jgi:hypothetical protein